MAAAFIQSASGLLCCIAAAKHESEHRHQLQVYSLLQPVTQAAQAVRSWQESTIGLDGATGDSAGHATEGADMAISADEAHTIPGERIYSVAACLLTSPFSNLIPDELELLYPHRA